MEYGNRWRLRQWISARASGDFVRFVPTLSLPFINFSKFGPNRLRLGQVIRISAQVISSLPNLSPLKRTKKTINKFEI